jgi:uncharacterized protein
MLGFIAPYVGERLGYYVYLYVDPRTNEPFYVGKGQGERALAHLHDTSESLKVARIKEIQAIGLEPRIDILAHRLPSEEAAFRIEAAVIDAIGPDRLTNAVRGWESGKVGRMPLSGTEKRRRKGDIVNCSLQFTMSPLFPPLFPLCFPR